MFKPIPLDDIRSTYSDQLRVLHKLFPDFEELYLIRFLSHKKGHLDNTIKQVEKTISWRHENGFDKIRSDLEKGLRPHQFPYSDILLPAIPVFASEDRLGNPIFFEGLGQVDCNSINTIPLDNLRDFLFCYTEYLFTYLNLLCKKRGQFMSYVCVDDMSGLSLGHLGAIRKLMPLLALREENFPLLFGRVIICNAPWIFRSFWSLMSPILNSASATEVVSNPISVLSEISKDSIPHWMGGGVLGTGSDECSYYNEMSSICESGSRSNKTNNFTHVSYNDHDDTKVMIASEDIKIFKDSSLNESLKNEKNEEHRLNNVDIREKSNESSSISTFGLELHPVDSIHPVDGHVVSPDTSDTVVYIEQENDNIRLNNNIPSNYIYRRINDNTESKFISDSDDLETPMLGFRAPLIERNVHKLRGCSFSLVLVTIVSILIVWGIYAPSY